MVVWVLEPDAERCLRWASAASRVGRAEVAEVEEVAEGEVGVGTRRRSLDRCRAGGKR